MHRCQGVLFPLLRGLVAAGILVCPLIARAQAPTDLGELSLEQLMTLEVTSVSRQPERFFEAASAIYVLESDDLERAHVRTLSEALRLVPGVEVARIDASKVAISIRGFNQRFARNLLVMIDGRSIYTPLFSGVLWDAQDLLVEDIERIEVIRGPGATLWGANAVNGVINIITRDAEQTRGGLAVLGGGTDGSLLETSVRYGGNLGENAWYRVFGKASGQSALTGLDDTPAADDWRAGRGGFRVDWRPGARDRLMLSGDAYTGSMGQRMRLADMESPPWRTVDEDADLGGMHLLARWERTTSVDSSLAMHASFERMHRREAVGEIDSENFALDLKYRWSPHPAHRVVAGASMLIYSDRFDGSEVLRFEPADRRLSTFGAYLQDTISVGDDLTLTIGSKLEHNDFTGLEIQPSARAAWTPAPGHVLWGAVSRAVRQPSRMDHDVIALSRVDPPELAGGLPTAAYLLGDPTFEAEDVLAWEIGYRTRPHPELFIDVAAFYNRYDDQQLFAFDPSIVEARLDPAPHLAVGLRAGNLYSGTTRGFDLVLNWQPRQDLRLMAGYTLLDSELSPEPGAPPTVVPFHYVDRDPDHLLKMRADWDLASDWSLSSAFSWTAALDEGNVVGRVPARTRLDLGVSHALPHRLEIEAGVRNLLDPGVLEFYVPFWTLPSVTPRTAYARLGWRF